MATSSVALADGGNPSTLQTRFCYEATPVVELSPQLPAGRFGRLPRRVCRLDLARKQSLAIGASRGFALRLAAGARRHPRLEARRLGAAKRASQVRRVH